MKVNPKQMINADNKRGEMLRFAMVGGFCTVLQYGMYVVFVHAVKVPAVVSTMISYGISFIANFILSSLFTFKKKATAGRGLGFTLSHLINMGLQTGLVAIFKGIVGKTLALLPALVICVPANYFMVRFAFRSKFFSRSWHDIFHGKRKDENAKSSKQVENNNN